GIVRPWGWRARRSLARATASAMLEGVPLTPGPGAHKDDAASEVAGGAGGEDEHATAPRHAIPTQRAVSMLPVTRRVAALRPLGRGCCPKVVGCANMVSLRWPKRCI